MLTSRVEQNGFIIGDASKNPLLKPISFLEALLFTARGDIREVPYKT